MYTLYFYIIYWASEAASYKNKTYKYLQESNINFNFTLPALEQTTTFQSGWLREPGHKILTDSHLLFFFFFFFFQHNKMQEFSPHPKFQLRTLRLDSLPLWTPPDYGYEYCKQEYVYISKKRSDQILTFLASERKKKNLSYGKLSNCRS